MTRDLIVIQPQGSLDITSSDDLRLEIVEAIAQQSQFILIDCQNITFMDSSGLSALVMALKRAKSANIKLALCAISQQAHLLFQVTGMYKVFDTFETQEAFEHAMSAVC